MSNPLQLNDDHGNPLPQDVQKRVNDFIDSLDRIPWFKPADNLSKDAVDKQARFTLECFGVKAGIEYRRLKTPQDLEVARLAAWSAAWDAAWVAAWVAACLAAQDAAWDAAQDAAWDAAQDAAWVAAWVAAELLALDQMKGKYPNGAYTQLFKLWEMGLYPVGVLKDTGTFVIYVPPCKQKFPSEFSSL